MYLFASKKVYLFTAEYYQNDNLPEIIIVKLLINVKQRYSNAIFDILLHCNSNVNNMIQTKKTLFVLFSAAIILSLSSCASTRKTGCPTWSKVKVEQTAKKSV
jgi:hypothetical protein